MSQDTFANDPGAIDSVRAQLQRADNERQRLVKHRPPVRAESAIERQRRVLESINKAELAGERAHAAAVAKYHRAPKALSEGTASARRVNEALRPKTPNNAPSFTATDPYRLSDGIPVLRMVNSQFERREIDPVRRAKPAPSQAKQSRLQRFADRHLLKGRRPELLLVAAAYLCAAIYVASFYIQHRTGG